MLTYFVVPSSTEIMDGASDWFNPIFTEFLPWALIGLGIVLAIFLLKWIGTGFGHH